MDYYNVLGVDKSASESELKSAYKKASMQHHPDRTGGDDSQFKKINEAYSALKDPQKRQMYDQFGTTDPQQQGFNPGGGTSFHFNGGDVNEVFSRFFGEGFAQPQRRPQNQNITIGADINIEDIVKGKELIATYRLPTGREETVTIKIPKGVRPGDTMKYPGMGGDHVPHMPRGDLFVKVRVRRHPDYQVDGINLYIERNVSVFDLLLGTNIRVDTLHGRKLSVSVPPGSNSGTTFSISGQGLPDQRSGQTGNLYVKVTGITPNITNEEIRERLAKIKDEIDISPK